MTGPIEQRTVLNIASPFAIPLRELIDTPLVRRAQGGDAQAVAELLDRARPLVERTVRRLSLAEPELVEDLVQTCLAVVFAELGELRAPEAFVRWAQGIARNVCCKEARRHGSMRAATARIAQRMLTGPVGRGVLVDPEEVAVQAERHAHLKRMLEALPARYRNVVTMRAVEGYTYEEIGEILHAPRELVRLWHFRGRRRLQSLCWGDDLLAPDEAHRTAASAAA